MSICDRSNIGGVARCLVLVLLLAAVMSPAPVTAKVLDFGAALQHCQTGRIIKTVRLEGGGWMRVHARNNGCGPDICVVFDTAHPTGGDDDLGTPNEDFDGPGEGEGGERDARGRNDEPLGKVLIIPENDIDKDDDGLVDNPDDESSGGLLWLEFSHAGRLSLTLVDVDCDEDEPRLFLYRDEELVEVVSGASLGDNSVQRLDLASYGDVDEVKLCLEGSTGIGAIELEVITVGVQPESWSAIKSLFR